MIFKKIKKIKISWKNVLKKIKKIKKWNKKNFKKLKIKFPKKIISCVI